MARLPSAKTSHYHTTLQCHAPLPERVGGPSRRIYDDVEIELDGDDWTYVACPHQAVMDTQYSVCTHAAHDDSIVIAVDGACRGNGTSAARSAIGIFFHENSDLNRQRVINSDDSHTNQRAELLAASEALNIATCIKFWNMCPGSREGPWQSLKRVVIKSDSMYLVKGMTDWIFAWKENGYLNSHGKPVANENLFRRIESQMLLLQKLGVRVQFWHVERASNQEADRLANQALDEDDRETEKTVNELMSLMQSWLV